MNRWLDIALVSGAVVLSALYATYALGPRRIKQAYSRFATKHFGLRVARWFGGSQGPSCDNCPANKTQEHRD
jgi:hypothetical protein